LEEGQDSPQAAEASGGRQRRVDTSTILYQASVQKFLAYSVVGSATFVGYVQLAIQSHLAPRGPNAAFLGLIVLFLAIVVGIAVAAAARQYYLIAALELPTELGLMDLEDALTREAPPLIVNSTVFVRNFARSATRPRAANFLTGAVALIMVAILLVLLYAIF